MTEQAMSKEKTPKQIVKMILRSKDKRLSELLIIEYGKRMWTDGVNAGQKSSKASMEDTMNLNQTRTQ